MVDFLFVCLLFLFLKVTPPIDPREYPTLKEISASKHLKIICISVADLHGGMIQITSACLGNQINLVALNGRLIPVYK